MKDEWPMMNKRKRRTLMIGERMGLVFPVKK